MRLFLFGNIVWIKLKNCPIVNTAAMQIVHKLNWRATSIFWVEKSLRKYRSTDIKKSNNKIKNKNYTVYLNFMVWYYLIYKIRFLELYRFLWILSFEYVCWNVPMILNTQLNQIKTICHNFKMEIFLHRLKILVKRIKLIMPFEIRKF